MSAKKVKNATAMRNHTCMKLAWHWLLVNRPDIAEAIKQEALKRFPKIRKGLIDPFVSSLKDRT